MKHIVIINAYGKKNIGDGAIQWSALSLIEKAVKSETKVTIIGEDPSAGIDFASKLLKIDHKQLPYGYAIRSKKNPVSQFLKLYRFIEIYIVSFILLIIPKLQSYVSTRSCYSFISTIRSADVVIGMGGGYLITRKPISDYFGLLLTLLPVFVAKWYKKKILNLPQTFGPFASRIHQQLAYLSISGTTYMCRDDISLRRIEGMDVKCLVKTIYIPDMALFCESYKQNEILKKMKSDCLILTAREWLPKIEQESYESALVQFINLAWNTYKLKTVFIVMANNPIEETDLPIAIRIKSKVTNKKNFKITIPKNHQEVQNILNESRLAICTRMHAAILASTVNTPFILIGYGDKSFGFINKLGLKQWYIDIAEVKKSHLFSMLDMLIKPFSYKMFLKQLNRYMSKTVRYRAITTSLVAKHISINT